MPPSEFVVFPAIDLRDGKVVRLIQGDPNRQTVYSNDPAEFAARWLDYGAEWLHIVNLSAAFGEEDTANLRALEKITSLDARVEYGGGLRDLEQVSRLSNLGVQRVFFGTSAIQQPQILTEAVHTFGAQLIAADLAAKDGIVMIKAWQESAGRSVNDAGKELFQLGIRRCVLTDVSRDGSGRGINIDSAKNLQSESGLVVVTSGGANSYDEILAAREAGLAGIILGRALYEGILDLRRCLEL